MRSPCLQVASASFEIREEFGAAFDATFASRISGADKLYSRIIPERNSEDQRLVHRQALAGML